MNSPSIKKKVRRATRRTCVKKNTTKSVLKKGVAATFRKRLISYQSAIKRATPQQRNELRNKIIKVRVLTKGKRYVKKINKIYERIKRLAIRKPTPAN